VEVSGLGTFSGTIGPDEQQEFTFTAPAGRRLFLDALDTDWEPLYIEIRDPSDTHICWGDPSWDNLLPVLPHSGTYTVIVHGYDSTSTGSYAFRLLDFSGAPELPLDTSISGTLDPGLGATAFRFDAAAGQRLFFDSGTNANGSWTLYGPSGEGLAGNWLGADFEATIPYAG
jgi:hypothetical protein